MRLMIEGDAGYLARVLKALDDAGLSAESGAGKALHVAPTTGTPSAGTGSPAMPTASIPGAPPPMPLTTGDDDGDDDDGAPIGLAPAGGVDSAGLPWDERIHASTKTTKADGTWTKRKRVDPATVAAVEQELRARAAPVQPVAQPAPVPVMSPVVQPTPAPIMPTAAPAMPVTTPAAPTPPTVDPTPPTPTGAMDFPTFFMQLQGQFQRINPATGQPFIDANYLAEVTAKVSQAWGIALNAITDLSTNPNAPAILEWAIQLMRAEGKWG